MDVVNRKWSDRLLEILALDKALLPATLVESQLVTYRLLAEPGSLLNPFMLRVMAPRPIRASFDTSLERLAALAEGGVDSAGT